MFFILKESLPSSRFYLEDDLSIKDKEIARLDRLKINMFNKIAIDAIQQVLIVCLIISVAVLNTSSNGYNYKRRLIETFKLETDDGSMINTHHDVWYWLQNKLAVGLRADKWYNGNQQPYGLAGYINDFNSRMIGYAVLRQVRVKNSKIFSY